MEGGASNNLFVSTNGRFVSSELMTPLLANRHLLLALLFRGKTDAVVSREECSDLLSHLGLDMPMMTKHEAKNSKLSKVVEA
jgi:hypothetical protein